MGYGRAFVIVLSASVLMAAIAASGFAAVEEKDQGEPAAKDHAPAGGGHGHAEQKEVPIFTPVRLDLAVWTLVVFLLLLFVLTKYAWNPMLEGLKKREGQIRAAIGLTFGRQPSGPVLSV